jgi:hypothetical protein
VAGAQQGIPSFRGRTPSKKNTGRRN